MAWLAPPPPRRGMTQVAVAPTRPSWPQRLLPYAFIAVVMGADLVTPRDVTLSSTLSVAPALAALVTRSMFQTILAATVAAGVSVASYTYSHNLAGDVEAAALGAILAVT